VPYDKIVGLDDAGALIPPEQASEIISATAQESAALALCRRANMSTKLYVQPVLSVLPIAYWVDGDTGLKQKTEAA
jgi:HK97 family phage major capsid protein